MTFEGVSNVCLGQTLRSRWQWTTAIHTRPALDNARLCQLLHERRSEAILLARPFMVKAIGSIGCQFMERLSMLISLAINSGSRSCGSLYRVVFTKALSAGRLKS
jgi:hypothetical protein